MNNIQFRDFEGATLHSFTLSEEKIEKKSNRKMDITEVKPLVGNTSDKWSRVTVDSVEFLMKFNVKENEKGELQSVTCSLSDFQSMWLETVTADTIIERLKRCNPLLACNEMMIRKISTITTCQPQNQNTITQLTATALNDNENIHLASKHYLSDGSDEIPLKFFWSLEKSASQSFYEIFTEMLMKISDLEKTNEFLSDELQNITMNSQITEITADDGGVGEKDNCSESAETVASGEGTGVCHEGITCNICDKDIFGHRYNCIECEDFDLCMECEHKDRQHTEHIMVRYAQPDDKTRSQQLFRIINEQTMQQRSSKRKRFSRH